MKRQRPLKGKVRKNEKGISDLRKPREKRVKFIPQEFEGVVSMGREGYGFIVSPESPIDIFVPAGRMRRALHNDRVRVRTTKSRGVEADGKPKKLDGEIFKIIERSAKPHLGILHINGEEVWLIMENRHMPYDIRISQESVTAWSKQIHHGLKAAVIVEHWPRNEVAPVGKIIDILGAAGSNDTEMHSILAEYGLPYKFEDEVEASAKMISDKITDEEIDKRRDFRDVPTFTIDPHDAKDFDDAISILYLENGNLEVGVHIADVTHYVSEGSVVDKAAYERATSVYLVDRTIPMLPENLSNKLCSLRPNEEKLCFSVVFELNINAEIINTWYGRTVICSDKRFAYEEAQEIIMKEVGPTSEFYKEIHDLHALAAIIRKKRLASGAIAFERAEMKVEVDQEGKPISVYQKIGVEANWLIEEFMLLANRSVAELINKRGGLRRGKDAKTFVYRIHETPPVSKLESLGKFASLFGYKLGTRRTNFSEMKGKKLSMALNQLLNDVKDKPEKPAIEIMALRSMSRARYSTNNCGHYGLAFDHYTHFTSPIRRYPDMMVHRLLARYLAGGDSMSKNHIEERCEHSSDREQIAMEAERASVKYKLVEFMKDKVGMIFDGNISGLTEWGMYVEIDSTKVEGMVSLRDIKGDFFEFSEETYSIRGVKSGRKYMLGDRVRIKVKRASLEQKLLDYELLIDADKA